MQLIFIEQVQIFLAKQLPDILLQVGLVITTIELQWVYGTGIHLRIKSPDQEFVGRFGYAAFEFLKTERQELQDGSSPCKRLAYPVHHRKVVTAGQNEPQ